MFWNKEPHSKINYHSMLTYITQLRLSPYYQLLIRYFQDPSLFYLENDATRNYLHDFSAPYWSWDPAPKRLFSNLMKDNAMTKMVPSKQCTVSIHDLENARHFLLGLHIVLKGKTVFAPQEHLIEHEWLARLVNGGINFHLSQQVSMQPPSDFFAHWSNEAKGQDSAPQLVEAFSNEFLMLKDKEQSIIKIMMIASSALYSGYINPELVCMVFNSYATLFNPQLVTLPNLQFLG